MIAAGARSHIPSIPGLDKVPYLLSENIFDITTLPETSSCWAADTNL